ncbi:hypothetical protein Hanom_Chr15g01365621 [Helianthus anomalus]
MRVDVLPIISLPCLRVGGCRVSAHLEEPRGWWRSSSRPWPHSTAPGVTVVGASFIVVQKKNYIH